jgi:hypothetical protein
MWFAGVTFGQSAVNPFEITQTTFNEDATQLWRKLGITDKIRNTSVAGAREIGGSFTCGQSGANYEAENASFDRILAEDGRDVVVRISFNSCDLHRFLFFHQGRGGWRLVDYLDSADSHYSPPEANVISSGGNRWLVITSYPRGGTGVGIQTADWYEIHEGKFRWVLAVPMKGHDMNYNPAREFSARFVRATTIAGRETLEFIYSISFESGFGSSNPFDQFLWQDEWTVAYSRAAGQVELKVDPKNSSTTKKIITDLFNYDTVENAELLGLVANHLLEIARQPNDPRRPWLKEVLNKYPNLRELAPVREVLREAR